MPIKMGSISKNDADNAKVYLAHDHVGFLTSASVPTIRRHRDKQDDEL